MFEVISCISKVKGHQVQIMCKAGTGARGATIRSLLSASSYSCPSEMGNYHVIGPVCVSVCVCVCVSVCLSVNTLAPAVFETGTSY